MTEQRYTIKELTKLFFVSEKTIQRWVSQSLIPFSKLPSGRTIFLKAEIDNHLKNLDKIQNKVIKKPILGRNLEYKKTGNDCKKEIFSEENINATINLIEISLNTKLVSEIFHHFKSLIGKAEIKNNFKKVNRSIISEGLGSNQKYESKSEKMYFESSFNENFTKYIGLFIDSFPIVGYEIDVKAEYFKIKVHKLINDHEQNEENKYISINSSNLILTNHVKNILINEIKKCVNIELGIDKKDYSYSDRLEAISNISGNPEKFMEYLMLPDSQGIALTKYWTQVWHDRPDLQIAFPDPHGKSQREFIFWINKYAKLENLYPNETFEITFENCNIHNFDDVNKYVYIGFLNTTNGLGEAARTNSQIISAAINNSIILSSGKGLSTFAYNRIDGYKESSNCKCKVPINFKFKNKIVFIHINPDIYDIFWKDFSWLNKYNNYLIFIWAWEMALPSPNMIRYARTANEIWGPSKFVTDSIRKISDTIDVYEFNHFVEKVRSRKSFNERGNYVLIVADMDSWPKRKNIMGSVDCYLASGIKVDLIIKTSNLSRNPMIQKDINRLMESNKRIKLIDKKLSFSDLEDLYVGAKAYISLHRSEGFGLNILRSMSHGTPVIVTNYSGNLEFCNQENSILIEQKQVDLDSVSASIFGHNTWAEPNVPQAANELNKLITNIDFFERISISSHEFVSNNLTLDIGSKIIKNRLSGIVIKSICKRFLLLSILPFLSVMNKTLRFPHRLKINLEELSNYQRGVL